MPYVLPVIPADSVYPARPGSIETPQTIRQYLDVASPQGLADVLRLILFGRFMRSQDVVLQTAAPAADLSQLSTLSSFNLDVQAPAASVQRAYSRVGTTGELANQAVNTTPSTGQIAVAPNGGIVVLTSDAQTNVDVEYRPEIGYSLFYPSAPVVSNVWTPPPAIVAQGIVYLQTAIADTGTTTGQNVIVAPGSASGTTKQANLNAAKTVVQFHTADAVLSADITIFVRPGTYLDGFGNPQSQNLDAILQLLNSSYV
jgi:hypothetical protein